MPNHQFDQQPPVGFNINELSSNPLAKMGMDYTRTEATKIFSQSKGIVENFLFSPKIRGYFDVDNAYLFSKTQMMFLPLKGKRSIFSKSSSEAPSSFGEIGTTDDQVKQGSFKLFICLFTQFFFKKSRIISLKM